MTRVEPKCKFTKSAWISKLNVSRIFPGFRLRCRKCPAARHSSTLMPKIRAKSASKRGPISSKLIVEEYTNMEYTVLCTLGCSNFNNSMTRIVEKAHNKIIRPVYKKVCFNILHHSFRISLQSLQKVLIRPLKKYSWKKTNLYKKRWILCWSQICLKYHPKKHAKKLWAKKSAKSALFGVYEKIFVFFCV